tara:strand:+ start:2254 stop:3231 length:978 start_codon:yes stop_codon:yes gene_type:complete
MQAVSQPQGICAQILYLVVALPLLFLSGCGPEADAPPIRIAASYWVGYEPFFQAEAQGFFPKGAVHLVETPNALSVEQTMRGGTLDALSLSLSRTLQYIEKGQAVSIVMILGWSNGADKLLARPDIKHVRELKGKTVGAELATVNSYLLYRALENNGLTLNDIVLSPLSNEGMEDGYHAGEIDAASVHGRAATIIEKSGANILFDSADIPGEIIDVLVVRNKFIEKYPERVKQLVEGWIKAVDYMKTEKNIEPYLIKPADFAEDYPKVRLAGYAENNHLLADEGKKLKEVIEKRRAFQKAFGMPPPPTTINFIDETAFFSIKPRE